MAKYNHQNYVKKISTMKNETLAREYWRVCFKVDIKFKDARIRVLTERMIKIFLATNPSGENIFDVVNYNTKIIAPPRDTETVLFSDCDKKTNKF